MKLLILVGGILLSQETDRPLHCDNYKQTKVSERCECARAMQKCNGMPQPPADVRMDKKCKTYCTAQHCMCSGKECTS